MTSLKNQCCQCTSPETSKHIQHNDNSSANLEEECLLGELVEACGGETFKASAFGSELLITDAVLGYSNSLNHKFLIKVREIGCALFVIHGRALT